jgi:hypothetical protein
MAQGAHMIPPFLTLGVVFVILYLVLASSHLSGYAGMQGLAESAEGKHTRAVLLVVTFREREVADAQLGNGKLGFGLGHGSAGRQPIPRSAGHTPHGCRGCHRARDNDPCR